jgi:hypothetical protein
MIWHTPTFLEINMSAEIGGYQSDFDNQESPVDVGVAAPSLHEPVRFRRSHAREADLLAQAMVVRVPRPGAGADVEVPSRDTRDLG